jgi:hypothetical protein
VTGESTPRPWRDAGTMGAIVSDDPAAIARRGEDNLRGYGGAVVGESIERPDRELILAAVEHYDRAQAPKFGEAIGENELAGLAVAFKALVVRAGGRVEITEAELLHARTLLARVEADPEIMVVELVDGDPPDTPRFDADWQAPA